MIELAFYYLFIFFTEDEINEGGCNMTGYKKSKIQHFLKQKTKQKNYGTLKVKVTNLLAG
jgi:hypothetical protein